MALFERDIKRITRGGGCLILFGAPFFFMGLFAVFLGVAGIDGQGARETWPAALFGLVFASVGAAFMFGRAGIILDLRRRRVTTWWGLLFPFKSTDHPLGSFTEISITHEIRKSKNSTYSVYPVRLVGGTPLLLREFRDRDSSRRLAEEVGKFLHLGVRDSVDGDVFREAGKLDESFRARAHRLGQAYDLASPPRDARCRLDPGKTEAVIDIPPPGVKPGQWIGLIVCCVVVGVIFFAGFLPMILDVEDPLFGALLAAFFILFFVTIPIGATARGIFRSATRRERIAVNSGRIEVLQGRNKIVLDASKIEEVEVTYLGGGGVEVRTDQRTVHVGGGLPPDELEWLRDVLCCYLARKQA